MQQDAPYLEPVRGEAARTRGWLLAPAGFAGGVLATVLLAPMVGDLLWPPPPPPAAAPAPAPAPSAAPARLPAATDVATLSAREAELAARLDQIEMRLGDVDTGSRLASGYATRAEGLMIAFAARRALDRGLPLGPLEAQLRERFGPSAGEQVDALVRSSTEPVTIEDLRLALETIAPRLMSPGPSETLWGRIRRTFNDLVVLRQADTPSPRPIDRLKRIRRLLDAGQVQAALAEVARMPGVDNAQSWVAAARRYVAARRALDALELAAMQVPAAPPPAPQPMPSPTPPAPASRGARN